MLVFFGLCMLIGWLVSAMSLVALQPELLERTFASNLEATADGNYRVQLFKQVGPA
jgi:hypothetical protein